MKTGEEADADLHLRWAKIEDETATEGWEISIHKILGGRLAAPTVTLATWSAIPYDPAASSSSKNNTATNSCRSYQPKYVNRVNVVHCPWGRFPWIDRNVAVAASARKIAMHRSSRKQFGPPAPRQHIRQRPCGGTVDTHTPCCSALVCQRYPGEKAEASGVPIWIRRARRVTSLM